MAKKNKVFKLPYVAIDTSDKDIHYLIREDGSPSVIIKITNSVLQYSADISKYKDVHRLFLNIVKILGEGHFVHKMDILSKKAYQSDIGKEYLQQTYDKHFNGRVYTTINTYLIITKICPKIGKEINLDSFKNNVFKILQLLNQDENGLKPILLNNIECDRLIKRILSLNFERENLVLDNFQPTDTEINMGDKVARIMSLIDTDIVDLPSEIAPFSEMKGKDAIKGFPVDNLGFLLNTPNFTTIIYNQILEIPDQTKTLQKLDTKKNRLRSIPDPANDISAEDIALLLEDAARENQMVVNAHFNFIVSADQDKITTVSNYIESNLFQLGIIPSRKSFNQFEMFRGSLPGNYAELKKYDWYLTTSEASLSFFFKEALPIDEPSPKGFFVRFTDRRGIPLRIDLADYPTLIAQWMTAKNKFVLGPTGSGKSFFMNALVEQYLLHNFDVVIVDTGDSYSGLASYKSAKYITYTEEKPITMNPFLIDKKEFNNEKKEALLSIIMLLWKGSNGVYSKVESTLISKLISSYYKTYFSNSDQHTNWIDSMSITEMEIYLNDEYAISNENIIKSNLQRLVGNDDEITEEILENLHKGDLKVIYKTILKETITELEADFKVHSLSFNSFFDFAMEKIPLIIKSAGIHFDLKEFKFILKDFYKGGIYGTILNEQQDKSLFDERFIVFEIDNIKNNPILFPIITLIIMDVFIQKMRFKETQRKALIIEEAWKAISSPVMATNIVYLYKTVRKFDGEAILVTQQLNDIVGNEIVKDTIIANSDTICLLDQKKFESNYDDVAKILSINDVERKKIFTINNLDNKDGRGRFKEVYIRRGAVGNIYGVEVSFEQYLTYTTDKPEKLAIQSYAKCYGSYPDGLEEFKTSMYKTKLTLAQFVDMTNILGILTDPIYSIYSMYYTKYQQRAWQYLKQEIQDSGLSAKEFIKSKYQLELIA